ncbi:MAG: glycosyltransferase [Chthoniobacterales bacterium]|nr:glycosyltransferase [Chthoniobacterales bacterium]
MTTSTPAEFLRDPLDAAPTTRPVRRVLHVFHSLGVGGAEAWLVAMLEWIRENGRTLPVDLRVDVCITGGERTVLDERVETLGSRIYYLRYDRAHLYSFTKAFRRLLACGRYDAIHDHGDYGAGVHLLLGSGQLPRARVVHIHNPAATFGPSLLKRLGRAVGRAGLTRFATTVAGTSLRILHEYSFAPSADISQRRMALHCGFDLTPFAYDAERARAELRKEFGWSDETKILLFVGRLESHFNQKNPRFALAVARACIQRDSRVRAIFVGSGDEARREIQAELEAEHLDEAIRLPGLRFDVPRMMLAAELLLFPSIAEGLGMVAVEAQAAGLRVLASDSTPRECVVVPELVEFLSLGASPSEWADRALKIMTSSPPSRATARAAVYDSSFSVENSIRALLDEYDFGTTSPP